MRRALALVVLGALAAGPVAAFTPELPATAVQSFSSSVGPDRLSLPVGPVVAGKVQTKDYDGTILRQAWKLQGLSMTTYQMLDPLRAQLVGQGYSILTDCDAKTCGGFDFRFAIEVIDDPSMHVDLGDFRYLAAEKPGPEGVEGVGILISRSATAGYYQLLQAIPGATAEPPPRAPAGADGSDAPDLPAMPDLPAVPALPATPAPATAQGLPEPPPGAAAAEPAMPADLAAALDRDGHVPLDDLVFESGSATLEAGQFASLAAVAAYMQANPGSILALIGHSDAVGSLESNILLSKRRAQSVVDRLVQDYGADRSRLSAEGAGYLAPRATNLTEAGRARNRRVEVIVTSTQ